MPFQRAPSSLERDIAGAGADALRLAAGAEGGGGHAGDGVDAADPGSPRPSRGGAERDTHIRAGSPGAGGRAHPAEAGGPEEADEGEHAAGPLFIDAWPVAGVSEAVGPEAVDPEVGVREGERTGVPIGGERAAPGGTHAARRPGVLGRLARTGRPTRWVTAAVALLVVLGAGTVWTLRQVDGFGSTSDPDRPAAASSTWRPWRIALRDAAGLPAPQGNDARMAYCAYGKGALYCTQRGIAAARFEPGRGRVTWSTAGAGAADGPYRTTPPSRTPTPPPRRARTRAGNRRACPSAPVFAAGLVQTLSPDGTRLTARDPASKRQR